MSPIKHRKLYEITTKSVAFLKTIRGPFFGRIIPTSSSSRCLCNSRTSVMQQKMMASNKSDFNQNHLKSSWWLNQPHLKHNSQIGSFPPSRGKNMKHIWNHHLEMLVIFRETFQKMAENLGPDLANYCSLHPPEFEKKIPKEMGRLEDISFKYGCFRYLC